MKKEQIVTFSVDGLKLTVPEQIYSRLSSLAHVSGMHTVAYVRRIMKNEAYSVSEWSSFPPEAEAVLKLYRFCLKESEATINVLRNLRRVS